MADTTVSTDIDAFMQSADNAAARSSLELGATDTVEFGAFISPSGTTTEIDAVTDAAVGQVMMDTDRNRQVRFTGASDYLVVGCPSSEVYYVDPQNGDDATGSIGSLAFATINAALASGVADGASPLVVNCLAGAYSEVDALNGISTLSSVSISFEAGSVYFNDSMTGVFFDTTTATLQGLGYVGGELTLLSSNYGFFKGAGQTTATTLIQLRDVAQGSSASPLFEITSGNVEISVEAGLAFNLSSQPAITASGSAAVKASGINISYAAPFVVPVLPATTLSGTAKLWLTNFSAQHSGLCEITSDTACSLYLRDCNCSEGALAGTALTVKAPAASTNPKAFALGSTAVPKAATNITVDTTFGSFVVDAKAEDLF